MTGAASVAEPTRPIIEVVNVTKTYGKVQALRGANFSVYPGEVVALLGDNGAGKSTLVKTLSGVIQPDTGEVRANGEPVKLASPDDARALGLETVYQDLALAPDLDAAANLYLGRETLLPGLLGKLGVLDKAAMRRGTNEAFARLGTGVQDTAAAVHTMSGGQRQAVAVGRALTWARTVVLMDEPTAALGVVQSERVAKLIGQVKASGLAVVLVSHNLPFVFEVSDRIEVLRLGRRVARFDTRTATVEGVVAAMTGALVQEEEL